VTLSILRDPMPTAANSPVEHLLKQISGEYEQLSRQLKLIARYVEEHRDHIGLDGIQDVARQCGVQPSAVVRFAKHFGFSGFTEMQKVFRDVLSRQIAPTRNYKARIREVIASGTRTLSSADIAVEFLSGSIAGMQELQSSLDGRALGKAVDLLLATESVWIVGSRRSFPVAAYLDYALQHTEKRVQLVTALGSMHEGQLRSARAGDVLIAISFAPYAEETLAVAQAALARGAKLIAITDSRMSPLARDASALLLVQDHSTFGFRSLTSAMTLAQSLFIALAYRLELGREHEREAAPAS
jgi:DNA-binding MurR/RpiR family transcriptional regulator